MNLIQEFERTTGCAAWINSDLYPDGRIHTREYTEWLEQRLQQAEQFYPKKWKGRQFQVLNEDGSIYCAGRFESE